MPIDIRLTKAEARKLLKALPNEAWADWLRKVISEELELTGEPVKEPPLRRVTSSKVVGGSGTGARTCRIEQLECGHTWESASARWPNLPTDAAERRRCKACAR